MSDPTGGSPTLPQQWRYTPHAWRMARRVSRQRLDLYLRARSAAALPGARARLLAMGLPGDAVRHSLRMVRSVAAWPDAWTWTAQRFLGEARQQTTAGHLPEAAEARRCAALAYHAAHLLAFDDPKKARALRSSATALFAQAVPTILPGASRIGVPWRTSILPGYLLPGAPRNDPAPLAVLLNGSSTSKEELVGWADRFLVHGLAVLALDWPGTGEAADLGEASADCDDLTDGVLALARAQGLDEQRVALVGFSLGGALAVRAAAFDRRIAACVAVTPPFDAAPWLPSANRLLFDQLAAVAGGPGRLADLARGFALAEVVGRLRCPLLVLGAGRDLVVPPGEAIRLCAAAGELGTLLWHPDGSHGLYERVREWTDDVARWLVAVLGEHRPPVPSTQVDERASAPAVPAPTALPAGEGD